MSFSANASFTVSALLFASGMFSLRCVRSSPQAMFAAIPLLFSIEQFAEGCIWLSVGEGNEPLPADVSKYVFLVCSQVLWPLWVPLALHGIERDPRKRRWLSLLTGIGAVTSVSLGLRLFLFEAGVRVFNHHIVYEFSFPATLNWITSMFYFTATVVPFFISGVKRMHFLGILNMSSLFITVVFFGERYVISVWSFMAGLMSIAVMLVMLSLPRTSNRAFLRRRAGTIS